MRRSASRSSSPREVSGRPSSTLPRHSDSASPKCAGRSRRVRAQTPLALGRQALEARGVEPGRGRPRPRSRPRACRSPRRRAPCAARDVALDRLRRAGRRSVAPQLVHQPRRRHDLAGVQQQDAEQRLLLGGAEVDGGAVLGHLERTKDPELHRLIRSPGVATVPPRIHQRLTRDQPRWRTVRCVEPRFSETTTPTPDDTERPSEAPAVGASLSHAGRHASCGRGASTRRTSSGETLLRPPGPARGPARRRVRRARARAAARAAGDAAAASRTRPSPPIA